MGTDRPRIRYSRLPRRYVPPSSEAEVPLTQLIPKYEAAKAALAEVFTLDEVKDIADVADALVACARLLKPELEQDFVRFKIDVYRRLGELCLALPTVPHGPGRGHRKSRTGAGTAFHSKGQRLAEAGISRTEANRAERLSQIAVEKIDRYFADKARAHELVSFTAAVPSLLTLDRMTETGDRALDQTMERAAEQRRGIRRLQRRHQASVASRKKLDQIFRLAQHLNNEQIFEAVVMLVHDLTAPGSSKSWAASLPTARLMSWSATFRAAPVRSVRPKSGRF